MQEAQVYSHSGQIGRQGARGMQAETALRAIPSPRRASHPRSTTTTMTNILYYIFKSYLLLLYLRLRRNQTAARPQGRYAAEAGQGG
eukprot:7595669-Pyramimonas_sp.AAC.1